MIAVVNRFGPLVAKVVDLISRRHKDPTVPLVANTIPLSERWQFPTPFAVLHEEPGPDSLVHGKLVIEDPDGPGPEPARLVAHVENVHVKCGPGETCEDWTFDDSDRRAVKLRALASQIPVQDRASIGMA